MHTITISETIGELEKIRTILESIDKSIPDIINDNGEPLDDETIQIMSDQIFHMETLITALQSSIEDYEPD